MYAAKHYKPQHGEQYYYLLLDGGIEIEEITWSDHPMHETDYHLGNCFATRHEAEKASARVLKSLHNECTLSKEEKDLLKNLIEKEIKNIQTDKSTVSKLLEIIHKLDY